MRAYECLQYDPFLEDRLNREMGKIFEEQKKQEAHDSKDALLSPKLLKFDRLLHVVRILLPLGAKFSPVFIYISIALELPNLIGGMLAFRQISARVSYQAAIEMMRCNFYRFAIIWVALIDWRAGFLVAVVEAATLVELVTGEGKANRA